MGTLEIVQGPPPEIADMIGGLAGGMQWLHDFVRDQLGGRVTSWWRSVDHNRAVGGVKHSQHLYALALDVVWPTPEAQARGRRFMSELGMHLLDEGTHDHFQVFPAGLLERFGFFA